MSEASSRNFQQDCISISVALACLILAFCLRQNAQRAALRAAGQATSGKHLPESPSSSQQDCISLALRAPWRDATCVSEAFSVLSEYPAARARASYWFDKTVPRAKCAALHYARGPQRQARSGRTVRALICACSCF